MLVQATHDTRCQRQLPPSFPRCPASHPQLGRLSRGAQPVTHNWAIRRFASFKRTVSPNVVSRYSTSRNLILKCERISRLVLVELDRWTVNSVLMPRLVTALKIAIITYDASTRSSVTLTKNVCAV